MPTHSLIAYCVISKEDAWDGGSVLPRHQQTLADFIAEKNQAGRVAGPYGNYQQDEWALGDCFCEMAGRKIKKLPVLMAALEACEAKKAELVIPELNDLIRNESFTSPLLQAGVPFYCLDQPTITKETLPALAETFEKMRLRHSQRIRCALKQSASKLGNPNALKEITRVNKPKQENAILFALLLSPIIAHFRTQGYSQRKMVEALNNEGFLAPEGGQWVLSQLQKVLERVRLNDCALDVKQYLLDFEAKGYKVEQQLKALNALGARTPTRGDSWDKDLLSSVEERLTLIEDILSFNHFVINEIPKIHAWQQAGVSDEDIAERLKAAKIKLPNRILWELEQSEEAGESLEAYWQGSEVELACAVAIRRQRDMMHLFKPDAVDKAREFLASSERSIS